MIIAIFVNLPKLRRTVVIFSDDKFSLTNWKILLIILVNPPGIFYFESENLKS